MGSGTRQASWPPTSGAAAALMHPTPPRAPAPGLAAWPPLLLLLLLALSSPPVLAPHPLQAAQPAAADLGPCTARCPLPGVFSAHTLCSAVPSDFLYRAYVPRCNDEELTAVTAGHSTCHRAPPEVGPLCLHRPRPLPAGEGQVRDVDPGLDFGKSAHAEPSGTVVPTHQFTRVFLCQ